MAEKLIIQIDITDCKELLEEVNPDLSGEDPIIDLVIRDQHKTNDTARMLLSARELELVSPDILPSNKMALITGAAVKISEHVRDQSRDVEINNKHYQVREFLGPVENKEEHFIRTADREIIERAEQYIFKAALGHIFSRLKEIAQHDLDRIPALVDELKLKIDEMADRLCSK